MNQKNEFHITGYESSEKHYHDHSCGGPKEKIAKTWLEEDTVDAWRHERMYHLINPLLEAYPHASWLTCGDGRYGKDAHYIEKNGISVLATDISDTLLIEGKKAGYIRNYQKENAEALSFGGENFDFVFCKESYHHFTQPMIALYEMLRVSSKGVILIEPLDQYIDSYVPEIWFRHFKNLIKFLLGKKIEKHNFEESGNYIYRISKREIEKLSIAMNYKTVVLKGINDCYIKGVEFEKASPKSKLFRKIKRRIAFSNLLSRLRLNPYKLMCAIIFKIEPDVILKNKLRKKGCRVIDLPKNPYS